MRRKHTGDKDIEENKQGEVEEEKQKQTNKHTHQTKKDRGNAYLPASKNPSVVVACDFNSHTLSL